MPFWSGGMECKYLWVNALSLSLSVYIYFRRPLLTFPRPFNRYVWGDDVAKAKTQCESLDYLFQLAVEMHKLGLPWVKS